MHRVHAAVVGAEIAHEYCVRETSCVLQGSPFCDCACDSACSFSCAIISGGIPSKRVSEPMVRSMYLSNSCLHSAFETLLAPPAPPFGSGFSFGPLPPLPGPLPAAPAAPAAPAGPPVAER